MLIARWSEFAPTKSWRWRSERLCNLFTMVVSPTQSTRWILNIHVSYPHRRDSTVSLETLFFIRYSKWLLFCQIGRKQSQRKWNLDTKMLTISTYPRACCSRFHFTRSVRSLVKYVNTCPNKQTKKKTIKTSTTWIKRNRTHRAATCLSHKFKLTKPLLNWLSDELVVLLCL